MTTHYKNALQRVVKQNTDLDFANAFQSLLDEMILPQTKADSFPHFDIIKIEDDDSGDITYKINVAVAGYEEDDITVKYEDSSVVISGSKEVSTEVSYIHNGIAKRNFSKKFHLNPEILVKDVTLENGILTVHLYQEIPESRRPRVFDING